MLIECDFHSRERDTLFQTLQPFLHNPSSEYTNKEIFCEILKLKCPEGLNALGRYLFNGFSRRKNQE